MKEIGKKESIAGVTSVRSESGIGVSLNDLCQINEIRHDLESGFEWGNFASVTTHELQKSTHQTLSQLINSLLPYPAILVDAIDIDTPADVIVANELVLGW
jgi:hypothetical protein